MKKYKNVIRCVETGEEWNTLKEASKAMFVSPSALSLCLNGQNQTCAGMHWTREYRAVKLTGKAARELERKRIHQELSDMAGGYAFVAGEDNYFIAYDVEKGVITVCSTKTLKNAYTVYFATEDEATNAVYALGMKCLEEDYFGIDD